MHIGIPKERIINEYRVAATPKTVEKLIKLGFSVSVETGAGTLSHFNDEVFVSSGATVRDSNAEIWKSDIILKVNPPIEEEIDLIKEGSTLISFIWPSQNVELLKQLNHKTMTVMAMDTVPRISRAQSLDALSSMANIAGYRAIIEAAYALGRFLPGQMTAAGKIYPAKVMVIGAGVAGLSAIGTARSLGAIVRAFDTRPEVKEQVQSLGAEFLELNGIIQKVQEERSSRDGYAKIVSDTVVSAEKELFLKQASEVDIIITTALIPGQDPPCLITKEIVDNLKPGSVIVDLAAQEGGGNCELTVKDTITVTNNGVRILGYTDLPSRLPTQSSQLYGNNLVNLIQLLCKEKNGEIVIDFEDAVIRGMTVVHNGKITWPSPPIPIQQPSQQNHTDPNLKTITTQPQDRDKLNRIASWGGMIILFLMSLGWLAHMTTRDFLSHLTIFTLSCVLGYYVVWNVNHALHTPLMYVTNAISSIVVVGALLQISYGGWITFMSVIAVLIASINIFGSFTVTHRMLKMFRKN